MLLYPLLWLLVGHEFAQNAWHLQGGWLCSVTFTFLSLCLSLQLPLSQGSPAKERPITPITPRTSKKMFMDALLAPDMLTQEQLYDRDKAAELFTPGHADIGITVGICM